LRPPAEQFCGLDRRAMSFRDRLEVDQLTGDFLKFFHDVNSQKNPKMG
jgi:hypothetical protein